MTAQAKPIPPRPVRYQMPRGGGYNRQFNLEPTPGQILAARNNDARTRDGVLGASHGGRGKTPDEVWNKDFPNRDFMGAVGIAHPPPGNFLYERKPANPNSDSVQRLLDQASDQRSLPQGYGTGSVRSDNRDPGASTPILDADGKTQVGVGRAQPFDLAQARAELYRGYPEVFQAGTPENKAFVDYANAHGGGQAGEQAAHENRGAILGQIAFDKAAERSGGLGGRAEADDSASLVKAESDARAMAAANEAQLKGQQQYALDQARAQQKADAARRYDPDTLLGKAETAQQWAATVPERATSALENFGRNVIGVERNADPQGPGDLSNIPAGQGKAAARTMPNLGKSGAKIANDVRGTNDVYGILKPAPAQEHANTTAEHSTQPLTPGRFGSQPSRANPNTGAFMPADGWGLTPPASGTSAGSASGTTSASTTTQPTAKATPPGAPGSAASTDGTGTMRQPPNGNPAAVPGNSTSGPPADPAAPKPTALTSSSTSSPNGSKQFALDSTPPAPGNLDLNTSSSAGMVASTTLPSATPPTGGPGAGARPPANLVARSADGISSSDQEA